MASIRKLVRVAGCMAAAVAVSAAWAVEVSPDQAQAAAANWVRRNVRPLSATFSSHEVSGSLTSTNESGRALYHVVEMAGGGFVVTSGDTRVRPIVAFSASGNFDDGEASPLYALLQEDLAARLRVATEEQAGQRAMRLQSATPSSAEYEWENLLRDDGTNDRLDSARAKQVSDVRVDKLVRTSWDQSTWGNLASTPNAFNYYTPNNYVCGCVATAGAQIMKYWERPTGSVASFSRTCAVDDVEQQRSSIAGAFSWSDMPLSYASTPSISAAQQKALGMLAYNVGVAVGMNWTGFDTGSAASPSDLVNALRARFGYQSGAFVWYDLGVGGTTGLDNFKNALYASLDAGMPVTLSLGGDGGHAVIADGYGYSSNTLYTHLNMGWSGHDDVWYNLINEAIDASDTGYNFTVVKGIGFNIHPSTTGEVISGRVLDSVGKIVPGATVRLYNSSSTQIGTATANARGIYSFRVANTGTYKVTATSGGKTSSEASVNITDLSASGTWGYSGKSGNRWGVNLSISDLVARPVNDDFANAAVIYDSEGTASASNTGATDQSGEPLVKYNANATSTIWWTWTAPANGTVKFHTTNTVFDTVMGVYTGSSLSSLSVVKEDDDGGPNYTSICSFDAVSGTTYYIAVAGFGTNRGDIKLGWKLYGSNATYLKVEGYYPDVNCTLGSGAVNFASKVDCDGAWTVSLSGGGPWVQLTSSGGAGSGYFYFSVTENTGYDRTCLFTVKSGSLVARKHLTQYGPLGAPPASISNVGFNPNGGTLSGGNFGAKNGTAQTATLALTYGKGSYNSGMRATRGAGYAFNGFWTAASGGSQIYDANGKYVPNSLCWTSTGTWKHTGNAMLYAQWHTHTVKFDPNGGTLSGGNFGAKNGTSQIASLQVTCGAGAYNSGMRATKGGVTFNGWWTATSGGSQIYDSNGKYVPNSRCWTADGKWKHHGNAALYARWVATQNYTVTFNPNGGYLYGGNFGAANGTTGQAKITVTLGKASYNSGMRAIRTGYMFIGWWTATSGGSQIYDASGRYKPNSRCWTAGGTWQHAGNAALYARWLPVTTGGEAKWMLQGDGSWKSGAITHDEESWIQTTVNGSGTLTFHWKASCEGTADYEWDYLEWLVDGERKGKIAGTPGAWTAVSFQVNGAGTHTIGWCYSKDSSDTEGEDCGWIRNVYWSGSVK